ncbi:hypothetical protein [Moraxella catarrhalis]|uniref:hypothetical protein n=1 Tax=Moraxella catarrhalis TaxID=480 RepID=UPI00128C52B1|nr:hypothetical protein [Moraxella catarrhalis]
MSFPIVPIFLGFYNFMLFLANGWIVSTAHHYANAIHQGYPCTLSMLSSINRPSLALPASQA